MSILSSVRETTPQKLLADNFMQPYSDDKTNTLPRMVEVKRVLTEATPTARVLDQILRHNLKVFEPTYGNGCVSLVLRLVIYLLILVYPVMGLPSNTPTVKLSATVNIPAAEMNALYDLYNATTGENWRWRIGPLTGAHWNFSDLALNNPCVDQWQGITCSFTRPFKNFHVTSITLQLHRLVGTLPDTLDALTQLQSLDLDKNHVSGTLPASLGNLVQLKQLSLYSSFLTGSIPESIGNLVVLQQLILHDNFLTGSLPVSISSLSQLQDLDLSDNDLTGEIPESLVKLTQLVNLAMYNNYFKGTLPKSLGSLSQLQYLYLYKNQLSGTIPEALGNLTHVRFMYLYSNELTGNFPTSFSNLLELRYLYLYDNRLTGTISEVISSMFSLVSLEIDQNQLTGTIPESLGSLLQLVNLTLYTNYLTGTIPDSLQNLVNLRQLQIHDNNLFGTIPLFLGNMTRLYDLNFGKNRLTGIIPESLSYLIRLQYLYLFENHLSGTISNLLGNLTQLQYLELSTNHLTGTIPDTLRYLVQLRKLYLNENYLVGTIMDSLGSLKLLQDLYLDTNQLTGTIPEALGMLRRLYYLDLFENNLTGTLPESLGILKSLKELGLDSNYLSGCLPESLGNLSALNKIYLYSNHFSGSIPGSLGNLLIQYMSFDDNRLTGTIPESFGKLKLLVALELNANLLTGTVPESLGSLQLLHYLYLDMNQLTGSIPTFSAQSLQELWLFDNRLHGRIPSFANISSLRVLLLHRNSLTGCLDNVFDPTTQLRVETVVVANNQLTGTLPAALFQLKLQTFVGTSNCFIGPLPISDICNNLNMNGFVIDGISSATSCQNKLFIGPLSAYSLEHAIGGTLPTCLFQLPNITTLHLSGNGFTGSIPSDIQLSKTLSDLSLSHNALTGSIPLTVQLKNWDRVDLSYNRFMGTLASDFVSNRSINLENNRLSGNIPASFYPIKNLSILGSNTYSCRYDQSNLPEHDPNRQRYHCGSDSFDVLFYIWLGACVIAAIFWGQLKMQQKYKGQTVYTDIKQDGTNLYVTLNTVCRISVRSAVYSIVVLLPVYTICSLWFGTQTYAYAYQVSSVYLSGVVPFVLNLIVWWILLICILFTLLTEPAVASNGKANFNEQTQYSFLWQTMIIFVPYLLMDVIVVAGVNAAYVYVAVYKSSTLLIVVQTLLSIFKVIWSRWALPYMLVILTRRRKYGKVQVFTQIVVNLLNNIVIPCLIVAVVSPNCFYNALVAAPVVTSTVYAEECASSNIHGQCLRYLRKITLTSSFAPPLAYNYQCSSSLITYYSPAFMSMCIVSTFVTPLVQYLCQWLHTRATVGTLWHRLLDGSLSRITKPIRNHSSAADQEYVNIDCLMTTLVSIFGLILTFGVMFPPLCVTLTVSMLATVFYFQDNVNRFIASSTQQHPSCAESIRAECDSVNAMQILKDSVWLLITVSCWFYTLFLFDTLGDQVGFEGAYWVLIVMPLMPLVLYGLYIVVSRYNASPPFRIVHNESKHSQEQGKNKNTSEFEMKTITSSETEVHNILVHGVAVENDNTHFVHIIQADV